MWEIQNEIVGYQRWWETNEARVNSLFLNGSTKNWQQKIQNGAEPHNFPMKPPLKPPVLPIFWGAGEFKKPIPDPELPLHVLNYFQARWHDWPWVECSHPRFPKKGLVRNRVSSPVVLLFFVVTPKKRSLPFFEIFKLTNFSHVMSLDFSGIGLSFFDIHLNIGLWV